LLARKRSKRKRQAARYVAEAVTRVSQLTQHGRAFTVVCGNFAMRFGTSCLFVEGILGVRYLGWRVSCAESILLGMCLVWKVSCLEGILRGGYIARNVSCVECILRGRYLV
jgi:hypothetical protein